MSTKKGSKQNQLVGVSSEVQTNTENENFSEDEQKISKEMEEEFDEENDPMINDGTCIILTGVIMAIIYVGLNTTYLLTTHCQFLFEEYYPKLFSQQPGPLIDQRIDLFWWSLLLNLLHIPIPFFMLMAVNKVQISVILNIFLVFILILFLADILILIFGIVSRVFCNNSYLTFWNYCNDDNFCGVYGDQLGFCKENEFKGLDAIILEPKPAFNLFLIFSGIYFVLDLATMVFLLPSLLQLHERMFMYKYKK